MSGKPKAVVIYGSPGAGKGTQAELVAKHFGFVHFDTGKYLEALVHNPTHGNNSVIKRERKFFETGKLMTPSWVLRMVRKRAKEIAKAGLGIVFSGSPRTVYETKGLLPLLEKLYGRENILIFIIKVSSEISIKRNSSRLICRECGSPILHIKGVSFTIKNKCPFCGGELFKRSLDKPEIIKERIIEYNKRTKPVFQELKKSGYKLYEVKGVDLPFKVFQKIKKTIDAKSH